MEKTSPIESAAATMFKYPIKYNMVAILIYLIGMEIENLIKEIREKAQETGKLIPKESLLNPDQIEEATNNFTGFIKNALNVIAKRQITLNAISKQLEELDKQHKLLDDTIIGSIEYSSGMSKSALPQLVDMLQDLKSKKARVQELFYEIKNISDSINDFLQHQSNKWKEHQKQYALKLIAELEKNNLVLSEIEKQELIAPTKTFNEILNSLRKLGIIKT